MKPEELAKAMLEALLKEHAEERKRKAADKEWQQRVAAIRVRMRRKRTD